MGELIHAEGCGSYFAIWVNEKMIFLFWQVENMFLLNLPGYKTDHVQEGLIVLFVIAL